MVINLVSNGCETATRFSVVSVVSACYWYETATRFGVFSVEQPPTETVARPSKPFVKFVRFVVEFLVGSF